MAKINLLPWRDELREQRKREFQFVSVGVVIIGVLVVVAMYMFFAQKLNEQEQANQAVVAENQRMDAQLKSLDGLQDRRNAIVDRMKLIQGLESQRPITVRLLDEFARSIPNNLFITSFSRTGNQFIIKGKAESPNTVAELLRNLEASNWFRSVFMNSFVANTVAETNTTQTSVVPRVEANYGQFEVTAIVGEIAEIGVATTANSGVPTSVGPNVAMVENGSVDAAASGSVASKGVAP